MAIERGRLVRTKRFAPSGTVEETPERPPPDSPQAMVEEGLLMPMPNAMVPTSTDASSETQSCWFRRRD